MKRDRRPSRAKNLQLVRLVVRDGDHCHWCQVLFSAEHPVTLDHLIPRHYGGSSEDSNVVLACATCNSNRHHYVYCKGCGHRIRRFTTATWVNRRDCYHAACTPARAISPAEVDAASVAFATALATLDGDCRTGWSQ